MLAAAAAASVIGKRNWQLQRLLKMAPRSELVGKVGKVATVVTTEKESREHQCPSGTGDEEWQVHSWIQDMLEDSEVWQG